MGNNMQINSIEALVPVDYSNSDRPTVSGRELHEFLGVKSRYNDWFKSMSTYGFNENKDYVLVTKKIVTNNPKNPVSECADHQLTIQMAKEIAMLQRNEKGKIAREYFVKIEELWNSPEQIMARGLIAANQTINSLKLTVEAQTKQIEEMKPKATYYDKILNSKSLVTITEIAKDYGMTGKAMNKLLNQKKVQYLVNRTWVLYSKYDDKGYTGTKTVSFSSTEGYDCRMFIYDLLKKDGMIPVMEREENQ